MGVSPQLIVPRAQRMLTARTVLTGLLGVIVVATFGMLIISITMMNAFAMTLSVIGLLVFLGLIAAHLAGWRYSSHVTVITATIFTILGNPPDLTAQRLSFTVLIPPVLAAMFLPWYWTIIGFVVCVLGVGAQSGFTGPLFQADSIVLALVVVAGSAAAGAFGRNAQHTAEERSALLAEEKARVEQQAKKLADANHQLNAQISQQEELLRLVASLETPAVQLAEGVLLVPIVGHVDSRRAQDLTTKLLDTIHTQRAHHVILDLAAISLMDTGVTQALIATSQAINLLGCTVILSGISAEVALSLTGLGVNLGGIRTVRSPQEALSTIVQSQEPREGLVRPR